LVKLAREVLRKRAPWARGAGNCLMQAWAVCTAANLMGRHLQLFAGSAHWPCQLEPELVTFGYEWSGEIVVPGALPEIHVWAGDPRTGEFIDVTMPDWPKQSKKTAGLVWTAPRPPNVLWAMHDALPEHVDYRPTLEAGRYAQGRLLELAKNQAPA
jgi:hypothetical protein